MQAKEKLNISITSPSVYQPLALIQVLKSSEHQDKQNHLRLVESSNSPHQFIIDDNCYLFAMVIYLIRFVANLLMVRFLRAFPVQGIYFISFFQQHYAWPSWGRWRLDFPLCFSWTRTVFESNHSLCSRFFCVQSGLQTISGERTDILLPAE